MRSLANISLFLVVVIVGSCQSVKKHSELNASGFAAFEILEATHNKWYGGQPGVEGRHIYVKINNLEILLDSIYFRSMKTNMKRSTSSDSIFVGVFVNSKSNYVLDIDPKKEFGNKPLKKSLHSTFELHDDEAIVSYSIKNERGFFKIENLIETTPVNYP